MLPERWCECLEWSQNIDKVNAPNAFLHARNPNTYKGYDGVKFTHCPWCGTKLHRSDTSQTTDDNGA